MDRCNERWMLVCDSLLTRGEIGVLRMIAAGRSELEIAAEVNVSEKLIASCRERLFRKTGATNYAQLAHYAIAEGIVPVSATFVVLAGRPYDENETVGAREVFRSVGVPSPDNPRTAG